MLVKPYRAAYRLPDAEILQGLYQFVSSDKAASVAWLKDVLIQVADIELGSFSLRVVCEGNQMKLGLYLNANVSQTAILDEFHQDTLVCDQKLADFAVATNEAFDAFHFATSDLAIHRIKNVHRLPNGMPLLSQIQLFDLLNLLFNRQHHWHFPFMLQFNVEKVESTSEIQRAAKKWIVKLDFDNGIPRKNKTFIKKSVLDSLGASFQVDSLLCFPLEQSEEVLQTLDDLYYQAISPYGFKSLPLLKDELSEDLFHSALPLSKLEKCEPLEDISRLFDLRTMLKNLPVAENKDLPPASVKSELHGNFDVFLSYSSKNFNQAAAVCHGIEANNIRCWMAPRDIGPGDSYAAAIVKAIKECKVFVLVFSDASNASQHVLREVERAVNANKLIVPFKIEETELEPDLAYFISICHWLDAVTPPLKSHIDNLIETLKKQLAGS